MTSGPVEEHDPQEAGFQRIEDLATAYWFSETLFAAVELGIFTLLHPQGMSLGDLSRRLRIKKGPLERFLTALSRTGLVNKTDNKMDKPDGNAFYFNSETSGRYLVSGKQEYLGGSVLWRRELCSPWAGLRDCLKKGGRKDYLPATEEKELKGRRRRYIDAMDGVARAKVKEMLPFLGSFPLEGEMLDAGCGSGAMAEGFLEHAPSLKATLMDLPEVIGLIRKGPSKEAQNLFFCPANMLEPWPFEDERFDLIILSNVIHVYSKKELAHILKNAVRCLAGDGLLLIHDFFLEHRPDKAALFDLNMFINTMNGRVFSYSEIKKEMAPLGLSVAELAPLESDTALVMASRNPKTLQKLCLDKTSVLLNRLIDLGFRKAIPISARDIHVPGWTELKCRHGCGHYGEKPLCPPDAPHYEETKNLIRDCRRAVLLEGEPPAGEFQGKVLQAEKEAFHWGFYKAFSFWAGPCSLCHSCKKNKGCGAMRRNVRPSMEGAGIDVFETAKRAGIKLKTLRNGAPEESPYVKYFALLLLD
ncbi:MAG: DUF2284 domain-containing protein [Nitrospiraceae bacterium]|nr:DUF2284 domain-containing protein [Nitrospiraceae bacterium]MDA8091615.1 DUF2284 domain-containing protein [Nitrospiraceae bacterium]